MRSHDASLVQPLIATRQPASQGESLVVWAVWGLVLAAIAVTYSRLDPAVLYHVSRHGLANGLGRVLVESNFSLSLVAIAIALIALDGLPRRAWLAGAPAIVLCAVTACPGVVDQGDLDVRLVNAVPAIGVGMALVLTVLGARVRGMRFARRRPLDLARITIAAVVVALSIPWIVAELGFSLPDGLFLMRRVAVQPNGTLLPAVHLGHHHGLDGALLVLSALLLSRVRAKGQRLGVVLSLYLALMLAYGAMNLANDFWDEQVVKRGWIAWKIPDALQPSLGPVWLVTLALGACVAVCLLRERSDREAL